MTKHWLTLPPSLAILVSLFLFACGTEQPEQTENEDQIQKEQISVDASWLHQANIVLEQDIVHDFFSPPVASRIYLYPNLTAYELISKNTDQYHSLITVIDDFPVFPELKNKEMTEIAAVYSFLLVGRELVYTSNHIDEELEKLDSIYANQPLFEETKKYCEEVSQIMKNWLKEDQYNETRNMGDYVLLKEEDSWVPTPPDYMEALEPHWEKIRPVTLDSANQFFPQYPTEYSMDKTSLFYEELMEVYDAVKVRTDSTEAIAKFWDCNPIILMHKGHITYSEKKLTPGGHWFNIARMAAERENLNMEETAYMYASLSIGIFDAFISCWQAKYATNYIRPVTVIQNKIDPTWSPILITPNFPEYPSGHSVVSRSAATILTEQFGGEFSFIDSTEAPYGMPPRSFNSFIEASDEAAISRLYGGIHYAPAIYNGVKQGGQVGEHVLKTIHKLKK